MAIIKEILKNLPQSPGIYKMKDKEGTVIYVGKAKNLACRIKSYFQKNYKHSLRTKKLLENAFYLEFTETDSELEALILESNLIKELRPRYNILMKDDKSYVYIRIDLREDFPAVHVVREKNITAEDRKMREIKLFGPKLASSRVYETLRILKKLFPFRHCRLGIKWKGEGEEKRVEVTNRVIDFPCLDYFIKRCPGPCIGAISSVEYKKIVQQIVNFLDGKDHELKKSLKEQILVAASQKLFEKAARLRDKLFALESITQRQKITDIDRQDTDVINFTAELGHIYFNIFLIRNGKLVNQENFILDALEINQNDATHDLRETLESFIAQYYEKTSYIPKEILLPDELEYKNIFEKWLAQKRGEVVHLLNPKKGEKNKLLELCLKNAVSFAKQYKIKWLADQQSEGALKQLMGILKLNKLKRIEGFDISHIGGNETVGSMVIFENGIPKNEHYRHFKLRTISGKPDDYRSMEEVLMRRLKYLNAFNSSELKFKMPTKKDFEEIKKIIKKESLASDNMDKKDFITVKKNQKLIGFGRIMRLDNKISTISSLWVAPSERGGKLGYSIMKTLIKKAKIKRIYINTKKELEDYYAVFGFTVLREIPEILQKRKIQAGRPEVIPMVYDATKHKDDISLTSKPDLIVIDGGKGQLNCGIEILKKLNLEIPVIALAKQFEEIYVPNETAPILLEAGDEALKLLQRIRDESHRFAITFGRELHRKQILNPKI